MLGGNGAVRRATQAIANDAVRPSPAGPMSSYLLTSPKASLVHRFTETETHEIDGFFRQARRESAAVLKYGKILQRSMAEKDAISCLGFSETVY